MDNSRFVRMAKPPSMIVIHCSDTPNFQQVDIEAIRKNHMARGFSDIGYNLIVNADSEVHQTRPLNVVGAHAEGVNSISIGICLVGRDKYLKKQMDTLRYQIDGILQLYPIHVYNIVTHNHIESARAQGKTCPGFSVTQLIEWYLRPNSNALQDHIV